MIPSQSSTSDRWPELAYPAWRETAAALHLYCQIVGKYRLARAPWLNHSWHATLYPSARGLTTGLVPDLPGAIELTFDLLDHQLVGHSTAGRSASLPLGPTSVAAFDAGARALVAELGGTAEFNGVPNELPDPLPFAEDRARRPYDAQAVTRYFRAVVSITLVMQRFRTAFLGKVSPVHLFWGSFDLAVTRFSGQRAPPHPGGIPALPDTVTREAYSHEVASAGFWPGGGGVDFAAFYAYAYPSPAGFDAAAVAPAAAYFEPKLGEFLLPYDAVRGSADPEATLMAFLESTYRAAADLGGWDVGALECPVGQPRLPRPL